MEKLIILIPVYNDWKSLNLLIKKINFELNKENLNSEILIINDNSSLRIIFLKKKIIENKKNYFFESQNKCWKSKSYKYRFKLY